MYGLARNDVWIQATLFLHSMWNRQPEVKLSAERESLEFAAQEEAERERSALEARNLTQPILLPAAGLARYANPPVDTIFPLEYAFHLLGDLSGLTVLDYGCGSGENLIHLALRGATLIGLDLSPELIEIARRRAEAHKVKAQFIVGSAYATGLPSESVDVVFAIAIFHHLDLVAAKQELFRILKPNGRIIVQEPVRDSKLLCRLRGFLPARSEISSFEYPLTGAQMDQLCEGFQYGSIRRFRLPFVVIVEKWFPRFKRSAHWLDGWLLRSFPPLRHFATIEVRKLVQP